MDSSSLTQTSSLTFDLSDTILPNNKTDKQLILIIIGLILIYYFCIYNKKY